LLYSWKKGARFDSWNNLFNFRIWEQGFEHEHIDYHRYLSSLGREEVLPWDHIDTGLKKAHLLQELDKAFREELTLSCVENKCQECQGCTLWSQQKRKFDEKLEIPSLDYSFFGKKLNKVLRYCVFYSKLQRARYFSHMDVNHIIQRAFRRAGVSVVHSEGFHPKMLISYPPALPLGMEGHSECFEFKSCYFFEEETFIPHMNKYLPSGVKFTGLKRTESLVPSLNEEIKTLVYSVDLTNREVQNALRKANPKRKTVPFIDFDRVEKLINDFLAENHSESIEKICIDRKAAKLFLYVKHNLKKSIRAQDVIGRVLQMEGPIFSMARERILFKSEKKLT